MAYGRATVTVMQKLQEIGDEATLATADVMARLHISRRTLDRYVADGKLAALYLPSGHRRYSLTDVEALLSPAAPSALTPDGSDPDRPASTVPPVGAGRSSSAA